MTLTLSSSEIDGYCEKNSQVPSTLCEELEAYTLKNVEYSVMLTGPLVGSFLGLLTQLIQAKRILEVGTYTGYSALAMAERLPANGELITLDVNAQNTAIGKSFWERSPHGKKIRSVLGPALDSIASLKGPLDLVFIDADKTNYRNYLDAVLPLLSPGGLIVADNCLWSGRVLNAATGDADTKALHDFNVYVHNHPRLTSTLIPMRDGLHLITLK